MGEQYLEDQQTMKKLQSDVKCRGIICLVMQQNPNIQVGRLLTAPFSGLLDDAAGSVACQEKAVAFVYRCFV